ncbi:hypothetical protein LYNGBM3L_69320 [Moorena producens 3L]|uniref:Uncharacterized protein n=1 Tax=Moorena producens 3L TaxID=489825 RepID=F4Y2K1_9CYAN|nr:hypothetical protein LYNGBM3L_69320 [Moorena producens 3L]
MGQLLNLIQIFTPLDHGCELGLKLILNRLKITSDPHPPLAFPAIGRPCASYKSLSGLIQAQSSQPPMRRAKSFQHPSRSE